MTKRLLLLSAGLLVSVAAVAQAAPAAPAAQSAPAQATPSSNLREMAPGPTHSDMMCAGFISNQNYAGSARITGGLGAPEQARWSEREFVYITGNAQQGQEYSVIRKLRDPNGYEAFNGQRAALRPLGAPYAEVARLRVTGHTDKVAIAQVTENCQYIVEGDYVVPAIQHPELQFKYVGAFDRFAAASGKASGRIVMAKDFDTLAGDGMKVYLNVGADKGVKPGDYFRAVRTAQDVRETPIDAMTNKASINEDTQANHAYSATLDAADQPRRVVAEMMVLNATPTSATAMITRAVEDVHVGDSVEMFDPPPPPPAPAAAAAPAPRAPMISCSAQPATVRAGDSANIMCQAESPDGRPVSVTYATDRGRMRPRGTTGVLDTANIGPGPVTVTATASDDRGMTASGNATVTVVAAPAAPTATRTDEVPFGANSAYVNNRAKAVLDGVALRLQQNPTSSAMVKGNGNTETPAGERIATARANNVRTYLTRDKGIDAARVQTGTAKGGDSAEIWTVPAGAQPPR